MPHQLSPASTFRSDARRAAAHADMMASPAFREAAAAALLAYQLSTVSGDIADPTSQLKAALKLKGAQEYLGVLLNLGEPDMPPATPTTATLVDPETFWRENPPAAPPTPTAPRRKR